MEPLEVRRLLSVVTWTNTAGGSWNTASNWSTGFVPGADSDVVINQPGNIQIALAGNASINSLSITGDTLTVSGGVLAAATTVTNNGTITLSNGSVGTGVGVNVLNNTSFESPAAGGSTTTSPTGWANWGNGAVSTQFAHSGVQSVSASGGNSGVGETIPATGGVSYTGTVYVTAPTQLTGPEGAFFNFIWYTTGGAQIYQVTNTVLTSSSAPGGPNAGSVGNAGWNFISKTVIAPANAASVQVDLDVGAFTGNGGTAGGTVYWDDVQFGATASVASNLTVPNLINNGTLNIGVSDIAAASSFTQSSTGKLNFVLGGAPSGLQFGVLNVSGTAALAGILSATTTNGYSPAISDGFNLINYAAETGAFSTYQLPSSASYHFGAAINPVYTGISALPLSLTTTVNAASVIHNDSTQLLGVNIDWWDQQIPTAQTQQLVQAAGLNVFRFPGGSSSDDYHFNNSANYFTGEATTPQFAQFVQSVNGTGIVSIDYGSGSPQEAEAELAYLDGSTSDTTVIGNGIEWNDLTSQWQTVNWQTVGYWASLRAAAPLAQDDGLNFLRIGRSAPFTGITDWEIGNEEYGGWEIDHHGTSLPGGGSTGSQHDPATYVQFAKTFAAFVASDQAKLPVLSIGIDSQDPTGAADGNWTRNVLTDGNNIGFVPGFVSDHSYMQGPSSESDAFLLNNTVSNTSSIRDWTTRYNDYASLLSQTLGSKAGSVQLMATEFNSVEYNPGKQTTSLVNGLFMADSLGSLLDSGYVGADVWDLRNGFLPGNNNSASLYGWRQGGDYGLLGDPFYTDLPNTGPYVEYPDYFGEQLAGKLIQTGGKVVSASSSYNEFSTYAVLEANGHLELLVINKNSDASLTEQFTMTGFTPSGLAQFYQYGEAQDNAQRLSTTGNSALASFSSPLNNTGGNFSLALPAYSMTLIDLAPLTAPVVASIVVNDGGAQRSMVDSLTVVFNEPVTLATGALTLQLLPPGGGTAVSQTFTQANPSGDRTTYVLTVSGGADVGGSLPDGNYNLLVHASLVTNSLGATLAGGDYNFGFYRLFGDFQGNGKVDFSSLVAVVQAFTKASGQPGYQWYEDINDAGVIGFASLVGVVQRLNQSVASLSGAMAGAPDVQPVAIASITPTFNAKASGLEAVNLNMTRVAFSSTLISDPSDNALLESSENVLD
jgi:alpha-L-arabinofuranosidase